MDQLVANMSTPVSPPKTRKLEWIEAPAQSTEDVLDAPFQPKKVVDQLR